MSNYFIFNGGQYKLEEDDGLIRVPLTCLEADSVVGDDQLPATWAANSTAETLELSRYVKDLEVGDNLYIQVIPSSVLIDGMFIMPNTAYAGMEADLNLVDVCAVAAAVDAGTDLSDPAIVPVITAANSLSVDFATALGESTTDACLKAEAYGLPYTDFRNGSAISYVPIAPLVPVGGAYYLRMTITAMPAEVPLDPCVPCGRAGYPTFRYGVAYRDLALDMQRVRQSCICPSSCD